MREINRIIIHHADTPANMDVGVEEIRRWHLSRGWRDVGYRDLTDREMDMVLDMIIERQPKIQDNVMRSIVYGER
jgi:hypothetical protein